MIEHTVKKSENRQIRFSRFKTVYSPAYGKGQTAKENNILIQRVVTPFQQPRIREYINNYLVENGIEYIQGEAILTGMMQSKDTYTMAELDKVNAFIKNYIAEKSGVPAVKKELTPAESLADTATADNPYCVPVEKTTGRILDKKGILRFPAAFKGLYLFRCDDKSPDMIPIDERRQAEIYQVVQGLEGKAFNDYARNWIDSKADTLVKPDGIHFNGICTHPQSGQSYNSSRRVMHEYRIDLSDITFTKKKSSSGVSAVALYSGGGIELQILKSGAELEIDIMSSIKVLPKEKISTLS